MISSIYSLISDTIEDIQRKIKESIEKFSVFQGLAGLKAKNICTTNTLGENELIEKEGNKEKIGLKNGDKIIFELDYNEIWLSVEMKVQMPTDRNYSVNLKIKVFLDDEVEDLKQNLIQISINFIWDITTKDNELNNTIYLLHDFCILDENKISISNKINELQEIKSIITVNRSYQAKVQFRIENKLSSKIY